jgi:RecG-like helicase
LRLRGPGELLGTAQGGISDLRFADFLTDTPRLKEARARAEKTRAEDPELEGHPGLGRLVGGGNGPVEVG